MILGFAHLSVNVSELDVAEIEWSEHGYTCQAIHRGVPNPSAKSLYRHKNPDFHDLMLMGGHGLWPIELTCHGNTEGENTVLIWSKEALTLQCRDPIDAAEFMVAGLGFQREETDYLILNSRLPGWNCRIRIVEGNPLPVSINASGPTCLAFYCARLEEDAHTLLNLNAGEYTGVFDIRVGDRDMNIAMLRAPFGILLELINPRVRN